MLRRWEVKQALKATVKRITPAFVLDNFRRYRKSWNYHAMTRQAKRAAQETKEIFDRAPKIPAWLDADQLEVLYKKYPPLPDYGYDPQSQEERGKERAEEVLALIPATEKNRVNTFLELACMDGMVSCMLQRMGKTTTATDIGKYESSTGFDERAVRAGVTCLEMDATRLQFQDESFDFVFSYNAFEHFSEPDKVLHECLRVVRTGGYIYHSFGPLYMSPWGLHGYRSLAIPYLQFLFPEPLIHDYCTARELNRIDFTDVNGWSVEAFRKMWQQCPRRLKTCEYRENYDVEHLDLIREYPSCFKSKTAYFENLIVKSIEVLLQKIG
jgi:SAM-dependent methyltransferase